MAYDLDNIPLESLLGPVSDATGALVRLDERLSRSAVGGGCTSRAHFAEACASLWIDGELIHLEDLVFLDAGLGVRAPSHELTIALDVLRTRRRLASQPPGWGLSEAGLRNLRGRGGEPTLGMSDLTDLETKSSRLVPDADEDDLAAHLAAVDALLLRSQALLDRAALPVQRRPITAERDSLVYKPDWDEDSRLAEWRAVLHKTERLPGVLRAAVLLDAWAALEVLQHAPWLGRLLVADVLRLSGLAHLPSVNIGLKAIPRELRSSRSRTHRLQATLAAFAAAAEAGLKEHDRLLLAQQQMQRRLAGRRQTSKLPQLIELVLSRPLVSAGMIAQSLSVTPQGALKIAAQLHLRELTGRGRFRAWGIL